MARAPGARSGMQGTSSGRLIVAGVGSFERRLPTRATHADLWAPLDALAARPERLTEIHSEPISDRAAARFASYINQAREYYAAVANVAPAAKPLIAYYFALNLTKAFLTAIEPNLTEGKLTHGLTSSPRSAQRYRFTQEHFRVKGSGVFRLLAERTGQRFCWPSGTEINLKAALSYLAEAKDLWLDAYGARPPMVPADSVTVLFGSVAGERQAWLRVDVAKNELSQRKLGAEKLRTEARVFGDRFVLVDTPDQPNHFSYQSIQTFKHHKRSDALGGLGRLYDEALFASQRYRLGCPKYIVLSRRVELLSHEALTFAVMHYLSDMVRYRPETVEKLRGTRDFWVFASWTDRACENYLLNMAGRISGEEHTIG